MPPNATEAIISQEVESYLSFLDPGEPLFTFAVFDKESEGVVPGYGVFTASVADMLTKLPELAEREKGATLHVTLNRTNDLGRKTANIVAARVLCVDLDTEVSREQIRAWVAEYAIALVVESSPGRFHLYWKIPDVTPLVFWSKCQLALAHFFGGDTNLAQVTKTIRVPGVPRLTKSGEVFTPRTVYYNSQCAPVLYPTTQFPWLDEEYEKALCEQQVARKRLSSELRSAAGQRGQLDPGTAGRNLTVYEAVKYRVSQVGSDPDSPPLSESEAIEYGLTVNEGFTATAPEKGPLSAEEATKAARAGYSRGLRTHATRAKKLRKFVELTSADAGVPVGAGKKLKKQNTVDSVFQSELVDDDAGIVVTNGHAEAKELKEELNKVLEQTLVGGPGSIPAAVPAELGTQDPLVGAYSPFEYDFSSGVLKANRFTDLAIPARMVQRFGQQMLVVDRQFYAFDSATAIWRMQDGLSHRQLFDFYKQCALDTIHDPEFVDALCIGKEGEFSLEKARRAQEKFLGLRLHGLSVRAVINSGDVKRASSDIFDAVPHLLYVGNGVLNMLSGEVRDARSDDYLLNRSEVSWDGSAECPWWLRFLGDVFADSNDPAAIISFMQELFGYTLSGLIDEQKIFCHFGSGANGKSKVLQALAMLGGEHATYIDPDDIVRTKGKFTKNFERFGSKIEGKRIGIIDDIDVGTMWNESFVKSITAPKIRCRAEHEQSRVRANRSKIHLGLNVAPTPEAENYGILRRLCFIPYDRQFVPDAKTSDHIDAMCHKEAAGILRWAVEGFRRLTDRGGMFYPPELSLMVEEYRAENFKVENLLDTMFELPTEAPDNASSVEAPALVMGGQRVGVVGWQFLTALVTDMNAYGVAEGIESQIASPDVLGKALRAKGFTVAKKWDNERGNNYRAVWIKLKYIRPTSRSASALLL